jgi:hypothetical protein
MTDRDEFLAWVRTALYAAEPALHNGDAVPRRALWSRTALASSFSGCTAYAFDLQACDVMDGMAYTAGLPARIRRVASCAPPRRPSNRMMAPGTL